MTVLVAGNAAILDLILQGDRIPGDSAVGVLARNPSASGQWFPGGAAFTVALSMRMQGLQVALWHPLSSDGEIETVIARLTRAGVDLARSPSVGESCARCVMVGTTERRLAWSTDNPAYLDTDFTTILEGISHVVICSRWGSWTEQLLVACQGRAVPISIVGEACDRILDFNWTYVVLNEAQFGQLRQITAGEVVVTKGAAGATVRIGRTQTKIPAVALEPVDTTGAGDSFGGTFIARRLMGDGHRAAAEAAARVAADTCLGWGAWAGLPEVREVGPSITREERVRGALAGIACGDAFGMPNSFLRNPAWLTEMMAGPADSPYHAGYPAGRVTDDTEQALAITEALEDGLTPAAVARRLNEWFVSVGGEQSLAVGPSTKRAMIAYQAQTPLSEIGRTGITNGAAMRIAPIGVYAGLRDMSLEGLIDAVEIACLPTHHTTPAISGAAAIAAAVAAGIRGEKWEEIVSSAVAAAQLGVHRGAWVYSADIADRILYARKLASKVRSDRELVEVISKVVGAGEPSTESVPAALAIAEYAHGAPARAIQLAGNLCGDTDTVAAMAGAVCGAYAGRAGLPDSWVALVREVNKLDFELWARRLWHCAVRHRKG